MRELVFHSLNQTYEKFYDMLLQFLPRLLAMAIIFVIGWFVAIFLKYVMRRVLALARMNSLSRHSGITQLLLKADLPPAAEVLSRLVFWVVWIGFLLLGVDTLGIPDFQLEISKFFQLVPQIFVALLVLLLGLLAANFFSRAALLAAVNANLPSARLVSGFVRLIIILLSVTMAMEQIALARSTVLITFTIAFGAIMLALAIAFGAGGREVAKSMLERMFPPKETKQQEEERRKQEEISPL
jgi:Mechanosensitive ion channel, conserved TM helix